MSQNLPAAPKPQIVAGGQVAALIPQSLDEAFRVANAVALSGLAPRGMDKPEQVLVAIMAGAELGLAPFQAVQSFAVVNNRPSIWGDAIPALLWSRGFKLKEWFDNDDEPTKAFCRITRPDGEEIERTYSVGDAKKAGLLGKQGPWQTNQKRMLQMRARAFAARDGAADVLRGVQVREEVEDYQPIRNVTPQPSGLAARLAAGRSTASEGFTAATADSSAQHTPHDPATGEVIEAEDAHFTDNADAIASEGAAELVQDGGDAAASDDFPGDRPAFNAVAWAEKLERDLPDYAGVDVMRLDWNEHKDELKTQATEVFRRVNLAVAKRAEEIASANAAAGAQI